jgi:DNA repair protein RecO (recombination protein O)
MKVSLQPAWVLHSRPYRDTSLLLELFTAEQGRISLVGRGVRRRSRGGSQSALLQPFNPLLVSFSGGGELRTLTGCEVAGEPVGLRGDRLFSALYLNELLMRLLHRHDPHPRLFAAYAAALEELAAAVRPDIPLRRFELGLLDELGYGFPLDRDGHSGEPIAAGATYRFDPDYGLVAADPDSGGLCGAELLRMAGGDFEGTARPVARQLLRQALASHLGPEPLRSRALFRSAGRG